MKITIDLSEAEEQKRYALSPGFVYNTLKKEYDVNLRNEYKENFWCMSHYCDKAARALYAQIIDRKENIKNLILTYKDAEKCFKLYKEFANTWAEIKSSEV